MKLIDSHNLLCNYTLVKDNVENLIFFYYTNRQEKLIEFNKKKSFSLCTNNTLLCQNKIVYNL